MSQQILLSGQAKTLTWAAVLRVRDEEAERAFIRTRWADGKPVRIHCGCPTVCECRRPTDTLPFRCGACRKDFGVTSGTLFHSHKTLLRNYFAATAPFYNEAKGKSALSLSRDLGTAYKTAFVLTRKIREAVASELKRTQINGHSEAAEVDGG